MNDSELLSDLITRMRDNCQEIDDEICAMQKRKRSQITAFINNINVLLKNKFIKITKICPSLNASYLEGVILFVHGVTYFNQLLYLHYSYAEITNYELKIITKQPGSSACINIPFEFEIIQQR